MKHVGIEAINIYASSLFLSQIELAKARGKDPEQVVTDYLIDVRTVVPPFEDTITMGANAAAPLFEFIDKNDIGMLITGTEGSVDFGKPISTNIHGALGLPPNVRNFETKFACYSGVSALDVAVNWVASGLNHGKKALVIAADFSRMHLNLKEEFVLGGVAAAMIISDTPQVVSYELDRKGTWTTDAYDTFRPSARDEVGNNEVSLYTYMDAIEGAFENYLENSPGEVDFDGDFRFFNYHTPFPGMAFQAHRTLSNITSTRRRNKQEIRDDFEKRVYPTLKFARRTGSTYGSSNFVGTCSLFSSDLDIKPGMRIGYYAYGSGAIGEFYSAVSCENAKETVTRMNIGENLDSRIQVSVDEYEKIEQQRESYIELKDFEPDLNVIPGLYDSLYDGQHKLVLRKVDDFYRTYEWS